MKNNMRKKLAIFLGVLLLISISLVFYQQHDQKEIIKTTLVWGNLSPIPQTAAISKIEKKGSAFTREFYISFSDSQSNIKQWLNESIGTSKVTPTIEGDYEKYSINPGGGAQFAEVIVNTRLNTVLIHVYWS